MHKEKLKDVAEITMGTSPSGDTYNEDGNGLPLLNGPTEFGKMSPNCTLFTTDSKRECKSGDLIFCVRGSTTGRMNWADQVYSLGRGVCSIRGNSKLDTKYVKYALDYSLKSLLKLAGGGTFPNLTKTTIHNFEIPYPDSRFEIASILSAFDGLIENNTRRIEILEEMARRIYREWFVHFRYPGHENDELVDSGTELGEIPEEWEVKSFDEIAEVLSGGTPKTKVNEYWNGDLPFFSPKDSTENFFVHDTSRTVSQKGVDNCASKLFPPKTVFITARGTVGKLNMPLVPMAMNQSCYALKAKDGLGQYFIFFSIENLVKSLQKKAHGAVFDTIIMDTFKQIYSIVPPVELAKKFERKVEPMLDQIQVLLKKNDRLKETRDLLLPKLISGKIDLQQVTNQD